MKICKRCLVSGKVQGVFYRASTAEQARRLGVTGYAKNLVDGRVEVFVCGEASRVEELIAWMWQGPANAKVSDINVTSVDTEDSPKDFSTY